MKAFLPALCLFFSVTAGAQTKRSFDIFTCTVPKGWQTAITPTQLVIKKDNGVQYCNSYLMKATVSKGSAQADFDAAWALHAQKHGLTTPANTSMGNRNGQDIVAGYGQADFNGQLFFIVVSSFTGSGVTYCVVTYFNDEKFSDAIAAFTNSVTVDGNKATALAGTELPAGGNPGTGSSSPVGDRTTNFDDGWVAKPGADYVQITKAGTEVRLYYINDLLEQQRPRTVDAPEYYWSKIIQPAFTAASTQKWEGVQYPIIYFMQGDGVNRQSGQRCHVAMKVIYEGGARVVVAITPDKTTYEQQFAHPNDLNRMLGYNRFAASSRDLVGTWVKSGGSGVEYYNAYTGNYGGMSAISTTDEFVFNANGTYTSTHNSANTNNGGTKFAAIRYNGRYTIRPWELMATNRVEGRTKKFWCRMEAVKGGLLLILTDSDYESLQYVMYRKQ